MVLYRCYKLETMCPSISARFSWCKLAQELVRYDYETLGNAGSRGCAEPAVASGNRGSGSVIRGSVTGLQYGGRRSGGRPGRTCALLPLPWRRENPGDLGAG